MFARPLLRPALAVALATLLGAATGCLVPPGACAGCSDLLDSCYCYDDWDAAECAEYDAEEVNGAEWTHYPLETCEEAGFVPTN